MFLCGMSEESGARPRCEKRHAPPCFGRSESGSQHPGAPDDHKNENSNPSVFPPFKRGSGVGIPFVPACLRASADTQHLVYPRHNPTSRGTVLAKNEAIFAACFPCLQPCQGTFLGVAPSKSCINEPIRQTRASWLSFVVSPGIFGLFDFWTFGLFPLTAVHHARRITKTWHRIG